MSLGPGWRTRPAPLELDFSGRRPFPGGLGWVLLVLGLGVGGLELADWRAGEADLAEREAIVERLRHQVQRSRPALAAAGRSPVGEAEARPAVRLAHHLAADWGALLQDLAGAEDDRLALLSLEADAARGELRLTGEAKSLVAVFDYLARLESAAAVTEARLTGYEREQVGAVELIRFHATAGWEGRP
jgi:hypothetical protein